MGEGGTHSYTHSSLSLSGIYNHLSSEIRYRPFLHTALYSSFLDGFLLGLALNTDFVLLIPIPPVLIHQRHLSHFSPDPLSGALAMISNLPSSNRAANYI